MKTPSDWMNQFTGLHEPILVTVNQMAIREIQLDAFKAGAEWAAKIADAYYGKGLDSTTYYDQGGDGALTKKEIRDEILSASSNLKELPK